LSGTLAAPPASVCANAGVMLPEATISNRPAQMPLIIVTPSLGLA
jgi:hypothetical protein